METDQGREHSFEKGPELIPTHPVGIARLGMGTADLQILPQSPPRIHGEDGPQPSGGTPEKGNQRQQ